MCVWLRQRIGYLAASQSFHEGTDVLMLTTNMIRKVTHSCCCCASLVYCKKEPEHCLRSIKNVEISLASKFGHYTSALLLLLFTHF